MRIIISVAALIDMYVTDGSSCPHGQEAEPHIAPDGQARTIQDS